MAGELGEVFDAVHHSAAGVGEGEHESLVGDEFFHAAVLPRGVRSLVGGELRGTS